MSNSFADLFKRYNDHHPGKQVTGESLAELLSNRKKGNLALDIGAGDGIVTSYLAKYFNRVDAIERNEELTRSLELRAGNINVINDDFLDCELNDKYDFVLMSYVLDSYNKEKTGEIMRKISTIIAQDGIIVAVSRKGGCDYSKFSEIVCAELGIQRNGGMANVAKRLAPNGYGCSLLKSFDSYIWGKDIDDLFLNLSFFYKNNLDGYLGNKEKYTKLLREFAREHNKKPALHVREAIFEIKDSCQ